jgi:hypothetical protein
MFAALFGGCNEGLAPKQASQKSYLNGTLIFKGGKDPWPQDSVIAVRVAAFKNYPFSGSSGIMQEILNGNAYFTPESLPLFVDSASFSIEITSPPVLLKYIGAALQLDSNILDQRVIGVYTESGDNTHPSTIFVEEGKTYDIRIMIDFNKLPPQPSEFVHLSDSAKNAR